MDNETLSLDARLHKGGIHADTVPLLRGSRPVRKNSAPSQAQKDQERPALFSGQGPLDVGYRVSKYLYQVREAGEGRGANGDRFGSAHPPGSLAYLLDRSAPRSGKEKADPALDPANPGGLSLG